VPLADIEAMPPEDRDSLLAPVDSLLVHLPRLDLDANQTRSFTHGQSDRAALVRRGRMFRVYAWGRFSWRGKSR
jgi:tRNA pseudouridine55 synthase